MCFPINRCWFNVLNGSESPKVEAVRVDMDEALGVSTEPLEQPTLAQMFLSKLSSVACCEISPWSVAGTWLITMEALSFRQ